MYVIRTTTTACIRRRGCFHFDVIYWCSLTAAFRILISVILFANSALLFARVHVKTFHISISPHSPRKRFCCLSREKDDIKRENERPKSDGVPGESMFVVATALVLLVLLVLVTTLMIYTQPLVLEQNCPPFSGKRLRGGRISTPTTVTRSLARTQKRKSDMQQQQRSYRFRFFFSRRCVYLSRVANETDRFLFVGVVETVRLPPRRKFSRESDETRHRTIFRDGKVRRVERRRDV